MLLITFYKGGWTLHQSVVAFFLFFYATVCWGDSGILVLCLEGLDSGREIVDSLGTMVERYTCSKVQSILDNVVTPLHNVLVRLPVRPSIFVTSQLVTPTIEWNLNLFFQAWYLNLFFLCNITKLFLLGILWLSIQTRTFNKCNLCVNISFTFGVSANQDVDLLISSDDIISINL